MKTIVLTTIVLGLTAAACCGEPARSNLAEESNDMKAQAAAFLDAYQKQSAELELRVTLTSWAAANSGKKEDFDASAEAALRMREFHSNADAYRKVRALLKNRDQLDPLQARALRVAELAFRGNQLPREMLRKMVQLGTEIEKIFNTTRATIGGKRYSNNDLLEMIRKETNGRRRREIWESLKQVGGTVGPKLVALTRLRNEAAVKLGYANFWEMEIKLQEHDPERLLGIFAELERVTDEPFKRMKAQMDGELARRFKIDAQSMMPWHYDNPFFQAAPPSEKVDLDEFYKHMTKEEIVALAEKFFAGVGLPIEEIVARSDLYEREGKSQHAFCMSVDRADDVRTLCNIKPTAAWMDTMLHEQGHAVYDLHIGRSLPFNLRSPAHIFTTEGVAMLLGALAGNPTWLIDCAQVDPKRVEPLAEAILEQRRREQLIFARWTMVMLHFEKAMYENPDQDLNRLWWDNVERFQRLQRPPSRNQPDWASKPHFTVAPVYYHNYMLGELFAAQVRDVLAKSVDHRGSAATLSFTGRKQFGRFLKEKVFEPGHSMPWPEFVKQVTGEPLNAKYFAAEVR